MLGNPLVALSFTALLTCTGCLGALGVYVPGSGNKEADLELTDKYTGEVSQMHYEVGDEGVGIGLGAKLGQSWASMGGTSLDPGLAGEFHADFGYNTERFGGMASVAYGVDRGTKEDVEAAYGGLSVGGIGQFAIIPRVSLHAGLHRVLIGSLSIEGLDEGIDANGWRMGGGVDFTFYRGEMNEFALRADYRHQRSDSIQMAGADASWVGNAILGELIWISTP